MSERSRQGNRSVGSMAGSVQSCVVQVNHIQRMIDINASNLDGLRTQCTATSDLIQQEIKDQEVMSKLCIVCATLPFGESARIARERVLAVILSATVPFLAGTNLPK